MSSEVGMSDGGYQLDRIELRGLAAKGFHGLLAHERRDGQQFIADVVIHLDTGAAAAGDDLTLTVDYSVLATEIVDALSSDPVGLIETVAERVAAAAMAHSSVQIVDVTIHKPEAPLTVTFSDVSVSIRRDRVRTPTVSTVSTENTRVEEPPSEVVAEDSPESPPVGRLPGPSLPAPQLVAGQPVVISQPEPAPTEPQFFVPDWAPTGAQLPAGSQTEREPVPAMRGAEAAGSVDPSTWTPPPPGNGASGWNGAKASFDAPGAVQPGLNDEQESLEDSGSAGDPTIVWSPGLGIPKPSPLAPPAQTGPVSEGSTWAPVGSPWSPPMPPPPSAKPQGISSAKPQGTSSPKPQGISSPKPQGTSSAVVYAPSPPGSQVSPAPAPPIGFRPGASKSTSAAVPAKPTNKVAPPVAVPPPAPFQAGPMPLPPAPVPPAQERPAPVGDAKKPSAPGTAPASAVTPDSDMPDQSNPVSAQTNHPARKNDPADARPTGEVKASAVATAGSPVLATGGVVTDTPQQASGPVSGVLDQLPSALVDVVIAIGGNIGPVKETLRWAVQRLRTTPGLEVTGVAPLARSAAVGKPAQPDFLNTVVIGRTLLPPRELLRRLKALENEAGRVRTERNGPRTLDLDIIMYGNLTASSDDLELPHPRAHERAFVLQPWAALQPTAVLPGPGGGAVQRLAATAPDIGGVRWMALDWLTDPEPEPEPRKS